MGTDRSHTASSAELIVALVKSTEAVIGELTTTLRAFDLSPDDWLILDALAGSRTTDPTALSMTELSQCAMASGATLTRVVDALVSRALVYRDASASDRRKVEVHLSALGSELHATALVEVERLESDVRSAAGEAAVLLSSLRRIRSLDRAASRV